MNKLPSTPRTPSIDPAILRPGRLNDVVSFADIPPLPSEPPTYTVEDVTLGDKVKRKGAWYEVKGLRVGETSGVSLLLAGLGWTKFADGQEVLVQEAP